MALAAGKRLGPHEILSLIGAGGMGEVYRARDTRLDRLVAIKVLPVHLADRPEVRERFEREAKTIANLKHPNICVLYDIGHQDGMDYLVMEYLEGETLAQRLQKGPLPLEQVLQYAVEIADALDKAHRSGVTHRDIKPGNIMLVPQSGTGSKTGTKLLDFGLAKLKQEVAPKIPRSELPTGMGAPTAHGTILGTLQYMSPEQVEGKVDEIDGRTDIFGFGAVVYEMATGKKAFEGQTQASVISKILQVDPPPMSTLQPMTPPQLDRVVKRCLAKDREDRWQAMRDVCHELKGVAEAGPQIAQPVTTAAKGVRALSRRAMVWGLASLVLAAITGLAVWNRKPTAPPRPITRSVIGLPSGDRLAVGDRAAMALSPDGTQLAYTVTRGASRQIYLRPLDSLEAKLIPGTEGANNPFFSPDGQWLGFFADGKLKKVLTNGGAPQTLGDAPNHRGASWGDNDTIVFAPTPTSSLLRVSAAGGTPQPLTTLKAESSHRWPDVLPGGKAVIFTAGFPQNWDNAQIVLHSLETGARRVLIEGGTFARYVPTGHIVYARGGVLMAVPFDLKRLEVTGTAVSVVEGVYEGINGGNAEFSVSAAGTLVYVPGAIGGSLRTLVWVDRKGVEQPLAAPARAYAYPKLSPDGLGVAIMIGGARADVWVYDIPRSTLTRLTFEGNHHRPIWTPDGKRVVFGSAQGGPPNLFWKLADGSGTEERLTTSEYFHVAVSWSPDGQVLAFLQSNPSTGIDIWMLPLQGDRKPRPFLKTPFTETAPMFSPDGRWLAYQSDESGREEIYVQPYPGPGGKRQISTEGGTEPLWARSDRELFYRNGDRMMAVETRTEPTFSAGSPRLLFEGRYVSGSLYSAWYDVTPDGQRFLMVKETTQETATTQVNLVLNWFEELKRKVPGKQ